MGLTVNSAPDGFRPVGGGELIYQFTEASISGKPNYRVEIEMNGLSVPVAEFRPDASLVIRADIAPMIRAALTLAEATSGRIKTTYVKYQAVWEGGSDAQVPLSSDVIYAYCGVDHGLNHRTQFEITAAGGALNKFLIPTSKLYVFAGRKAYIEFLSAADLGVASRVDYLPTSGGTILLGGFNGSFAGLQSFDSTFSEGGHVKVWSASAAAYVCSIEVELVTLSCVRPVYLKWINDLGGLSSWLFSYNQIYELSPQLMWRDKVLTVSTDGLTMEQWQMLEELNKDGIEYGENQKSGAYVVDMTDATNEINVFVEPDDQETMTKMSRHNFEARLKYEQIPNLLL